MCKNKVGRSSEGLLDIEFYRLHCPTLTTPMPVVLVNFIYMWRHGFRQTTHKWVWGFSSPHGRYGDTAPVVTPTEVALKTKLRLINQ